MSNTNANIPVFIKVTSIQGAHHTYLPVDQISYIKPTHEGTQITTKAESDDDPGTIYQVRETIGNIFDQIRNPFSALPSEQRGPSVEEASERLAKAAAEKS